MQGTEKLRFGFNLRRKLRSTFICTVRKSMTKVDPSCGTKFWNGSVHCELHKTFKPVDNSGLF